MNARLKATEDSTPVFAVGEIREGIGPESTRFAGVLTDMLGTNLARVQGLSILSNWRLFEVMRPGQATLPGAYADAARRAGANELLEGQLLSGPAGGLTLELRRIDLRTGMLKGAYRVVAVDPYALIDSATAAIARDLHLGSPRGSVAEATTSSPVAYRLYEEGLRAYYQYDYPAARRLMEAALAEDSTFAMAAFYGSLTGGEGQDEFRRLALRLAQRAPERERLTISAFILTEVLDLAATAIAETLTTKYPNDPRALATLGKARFYEGDWAGMVEAYSRAAAIDSAAELVDKATCHLCDDLAMLAQAYAWWDSMPAWERTAARFLRLRPNDRQPYMYLSAVAARTGRDSQAVAAQRRQLVKGEAGPAPVPEATLQLALERYADVESTVRPLWLSTHVSDVHYARWLLLIALRNQGRLAEARLLQRANRLATLPPPGVQLGSEEFNEALLGLESGEPRSAMAVFARRHEVIHRETASWFPGLRARQLAWNGALLGTALAAAGETLAVRLLADTVEYWGRRSAFGRDRKVHHFLRGLVHAAGGRDEEAIREYRAAVHSWTLGYTRVNYELARVLLRQRRPHEAVAALQPALRGENDGPNLWITRTVLHELLAEAFDAAGRRDSAAVHYAAVVRAWSSADAVFHARRERAEEWLRKHAPPFAPTRTASAPGGDPR
jgi:tetratricopeptide (TPR) repeat protein